MGCQRKRPVKPALREYYPDFFVKVSSTEVYIVETKGQEDLDVPPKMARLKQWCDDINHAQSKVRYDFVFVDEEGFGKYPPAPTGGPACFSLDRGHG